MFTEIKIPRAKNNLNSGYTPTGGYGLRFELFIICSENEYN